MIWHCAALWVAGLDGIKRPVESMCISEASLHFRRPAPTWSMRRGSHRQSSSFSNFVFIIVTSSTWVCLLIWKLIFLIRFSAESVKVVWEQLHEYLVAEAWFIHSGVITWWEFWTLIKTQHEITILYILTVIIPWRGQQHFRNPGFCISVVCNRTRN